MSKAQRIRRERAEASDEQEQARAASPSYSRKLDWAEAHIDALATSIERWLEGNAYRFVGYVDPQTGDNVLEAKLAKPPREEWPLILGDAVHNLRSALDHIAYKLALDGYQAKNPGGTIPDGHQRRIMFPVIAVSNDPSKTVEEFYAEVIKGQLRYVPDAAAAVIESLQPYKRTSADPFSDPLWIVNELNVIDKHRKLHTAAVASPLQSLQLGGGSVHIKTLDVKGGPVEHDREILRWNFEGIDGQPPPQMEASFSRHIGLADIPRGWTQADILAVLRACYADIAENVIDALAAFL